MAIKLPFRLCSFVVYQAVEGGVKDATAKESRSQLSFTLMKKTRYNMGGFPWLSLDYSSLRRDPGRDHGSNISKSLIPINDVKNLIGSKCVI